jgi:signal transduction histidine kinase
MKARARSGRSNASPPGANVEAKRRAASRSDRADKPERLTTRARSPREADAPAPLAIRAVPERITPRELEETTFTGTDLRPAEREQLVRRVLELEARVADLDAQLARSDRTVRALRDVGLALGSTLDLDQLLELILRKIADLLQADRATLYLLDEQRQRLLSRIILGDEAKSIELPVGAGFAGHVAKYGQTLRIKDAYRDRRFSRHWDDMTGYRTRSVLAAPMKNHVGKTIGVIQVLNKRGQPAGTVDEFSLHDEELLVALATQAAVSIDNSRLFLSVIQKNMQLVETKEQLEHRVADLKLLFELESSMARASTFDELAKAVIREAASACGAQAGAVMVDEGEDGVFLYFLDVSRGPEAELRRVGVRRGDGIIGLAMNTNEAQHLPPNDLTRIAPAPVPHHLGVQLGIEVRSAMAMPLEGADDAPLGALALYNAARPAGFSQDARALLRLISANASTAVSLFLSRSERERSRRLTSIGRLFSGVMHDLRTPLAVVGGYVQLMTTTEDAATRAEQARTIARQFELIAAMQREVLEFARGERSVLLRRVFLEKFVGELERSIRRELEGSRIELVVELRDRGAARFDELKVERMLSNLVRNAIEAMAERGGRLTLRVERDGDEVVFTVADEGRGIPDEIQGRLFGAFVTSGKRGGTGLGLSIVKKIVDEHRGTVAVASSPSGTTFTVRLPQSEHKDAATKRLVEEPLPRADNGTDGPSAPKGRNGSARQAKADGSTSAKRRAATRAESR